MLDNIFSTKYNIMSYCPAIVLDWYYYVPIATKNRQVN